MLNRLYGWYGVRVVRSIAAVIVVLVMVGIVLGMHDENVSLEKESVKQTLVTISRVDALTQKSEFTVVGAVAAIDEVRLQAETGGRVTSVNVALGDVVDAGTILATIENSAEYAQLLQAEGAYEAARAVSLEGSANLEEARVGVRNAYRDTFSTTETIVRSTIDQFFTSPLESINGFKISGTGRAQEFLAIRAEIESELETWSQNIKNNPSDQTEEDRLTHAEEIITVVSDLMASFVYLLADNSNEKSITDTERATYQSELAAGRSALDGALSTIARARLNYEQARISGSSEGTSRVSAQQKSALGVLKSAQAAYERTLIRTPIAGVVNTLSVKEGSYVNNGDEVALVANNGSLEVRTTLGEEDLLRVTVGDTVRLNETGTGNITHVAPAVDPISGRGEVRIYATSADSLVNGSTVRVTFIREISAKPTKGALAIPLSAVKLLPSGAVVFTVTAAHTLEAHTVTLGRITGDAVEILEGITGETEIVVDARGLRVGDTVQVTE